MAPRGPWRCLKRKSCLLLAGPAFHRVAIKRQDRGFGAMIDAANTRHPWPNDCVERYPF
jgi:hypothetical protein